ncbi:MAG: DUF2508 family protein [Firmicutes bacterium]|nr:DUF2508 family protein [Bacillota bacterium]
MPAQSSSGAGPEPVALTPAVPAEGAARVEQARREWMAAQNEFDAVTDPDLVDHAIFAMQAAERRYVYLLRLANRLRREALEAREAAAAPLTAPSPRPAGTPPTRTARRLRER